LKSIAQDIDNFTRYAISISLLSAILASISHLLTTLSAIFGTSTVIVQHYLNAVCFFYIDLDFLIYYPTACHTPYCVAMRLFTVISLFASVFDPIKTKNMVGIVASLLMYIHASRVEVVVREEANHVGEEKWHAIDIKDVSVLAGVTSFFVIVLCLLHKLDDIDPTTYDPLDDDSAVAGDDDYDVESNGKGGNGKPKIR
jgi:hypothetical protein